MYMHAEVVYMYMCVHHMYIQFLIVVQAEIYRKRVEPENLFSGTRGKEKKPSVEKKMTQTEKGQDARGNGGKTEQKQKYDHQNHPR